VPHILDLGTRRRWVVSFTHQLLYSQGKTPWHTLDGMWVGLRAGLDMMLQRKIPSPCQKSNPNHPIHDHHSLTELSQLIKEIKFETLKVLGIQ